MLIDLKFLSETDISDFVVVIGAGPAGISLCNELYERKIRTVLIESGSFDYSARTQTLSEGLVDRSDGSLPHDDIHLWRMRMFGGSSNIWRGHVLNTTTRILLSSILVKVGPSRLARFLVTIAKRTNTLVSPIDMIKLMKSSMALEGLLISKRNPG